LTITVVATGERAKQERWFMIVKDSLDHALTGPTAAGIGHYETAMHHRAEHAARGSRGPERKRMRAFSRWWIEFLMNTCRGE